MCPRCLLHAGLSGGGSGDQPRPRREAVDLLSDEPRELPGTPIGRYTLIKEIGEGGFAIVYTAEQAEPVRHRVALKVLKPGMDTREIVARFEAERRALALMDHPNIAQVYDGGTTKSGRPYFVMELVKGVPLTQYCDDHRLPIRPRLELFLDVLAAVQHAHQKGIIHRDLKPANILVSSHDGRPVVKVIDFGIAKALGSELAGRTSFTGRGHLVGTPEYMSPEQADPAAVDVDTRSDVYSAGVVLYELLTGHTPVDTTNRRVSRHGEMQRLIRECDPPKPSSRLAALGDAQADVARRRGTAPPKLGRQLRGDLDWIVMKALEKDRTRRYATAAGLAADIRCFLKDEPVTARPPGMGYRFGKFARRNKAGLAVATLITIILLTATAVSVWEAVEATRARAETLVLLRQASLNEARALRLSGHAGRRFRALKSLRTAASIRAGHDLLDELVSVLGVADLQLAETWPTAAGLRDLAAVAPDFSVQASTGPDGSVSVHAVPQGSPAAVLPGRGVPVNWLLRFSPDSRLLAVGHARELQESVDATVWDWKNNVTLATIKGVTRSAVDFSPDGSVLAAALGRTLTLVDPRTGASLRSWPCLTGTPYCLRFRPDGKAVAVSSLDTGTVVIVDLADGRICANETFTRPRGIDWHRDGRRLAIACESAIVLWHTTEPERTKSIAVTPGSTIDRVAWSHASELLASSGWQQPVTLHDGALGTSLVSANGDVKALQFSPDDTRLGLVWNEGRLGLLEVADGRIARHAPGQGSVLVGTAWHPSGGVLATVSEHSVRFWNKEMRDLGGLAIRHGRFAGFTRHGLIMVASTLQRRTCTMDGEPPVLRLGPPELLDPRSGWDFASTTRDGAWLATAGHDRALLVDLAGRQPAREIGTHAQAAQAALSPDGEWLATATFYGTGVKIWSLPAGQLAAEFPGYSRCRVHFSHDGRWLIAATGAGYHFHRTGTWKLERTIPCNLGNDLGWLAWSPRGYVFALEPEDFTLAMYDTKTFSLAARPQFERQRPLGFNPEGTLLLTTDPQHRIHLWNLSLLRAGLKDHQADFKLPPLPPCSAPLVENVFLEETATPPPL